MARRRPLVLPRAAAARRARRGPARRRRGHQCTRPRRVLYGVHRVPELISDELHRRVAHVRRVHRPLVPVYVGAVYVFPREEAQRRAYRRRPNRALILGQLAVDALTVRAPRLLHRTLVRPRTGLEPVNLRLDPVRPFLDVGALLERGSKRALSRLGRGEKRGPDAFALAAGVAHRRVRRRLVAEPDQPLIEPLELVVRGGGRDEQALLRHHLRGGGPLQHGAHAVSGALELPRQVLPRDHVRVDHVSF